MVPGVGPTYTIPLHEPLSVLVGERMPPRRRQTMIVGAFTELTTAGGIQRVCRHTAIVLTDLAENRDAAVSLLSLNDAAGLHKVEVGGRAVTVEGFGRSKTRFVAALLRRMPQASLIYFAHVSLAPLGIPYRALRPGGCYWVAAFGIEVWSPLPWAVRAGLRLAHGATVISRFTEEAMRQVQGVSSRAMHLLPCALDPEMEEGEEPGVRSGLRLLTVARLVAVEGYKGVDRVIQALPKVAEQVPGVQYDVVGDGNDRPRLEALARECGVADRVFFRGRVSEAELVERYCEADVFVMPSRSEGFGIVYLEAMRYGSPVIAALEGGAPEVVVDGETGFLVGYDDVDALADRLALLLRDSGLRLRMGEAGRRRVREHFTFDRFHRRLSAILAGRAEAALPGGP